MNLAWYFGFGWSAVALCSAFGSASWYFATGWVHWLWYALFVITAAYMIIKGRLYWKEPWHRVNARGLSLYHKIIEREAAGAPQEGWELDTAALCGELARQLLGEAAAEEMVKRGLFSDEGRKEYYRQLVEANSQLFTNQIRPEQRARALQRIFQDIEASEEGSDIVIAVAVEKEYGRLEATRYFLALVSGLTMRRGLFS